MVHHKKHRLSVVIDQRVQQRQSQQQAYGKELVFEGTVSAGKEPVRSAAQEAQPQQHRMHDKHGDPGGCGKIGQQHQRIPV